MPDIHNRLITEFVLQGEQKTDQALKRFRSHVAESRKEINAAEQASKRWTAAVASISRENDMAAISKELQNATKNGQNLNEVLEKTKQRLVDIGASEGEIRRVLQSAQAAGGGGGRGAALRSVGREVRALPAVQIPGTGISTDVLGRAGEVAGKLGLSFKDLAIGGGIAAGAIIAVTVAFQHFQNTIKAVEDTLRKVTEARIEVAGVLVNATREELEARRDELELSKRRLQAQQQQALIDASIQAENARGQGIVGNFLVGLAKLGGGGPVGEAFGRVEKLSADLADVNTQLTAYNDALDSNATALQDAERAAEALSNKFQSQIDTNAQNTINLLTEAGSLTEKQVEDRIKGIHTEQEVIRQVLADGDISAKKADELNARLAELTGSLITLMGPVREIAQSNDAAAEAEQRRLNLAHEVQRAEDDRAKIEQDAAQKRADITQKYTDRLVDLAQQAADAAADALRKLQQKRDDLQTDLGRDQADSETKRQQKRLDLLIDFQRDEVKIREDHAAKLKEILSKSQLAERQAIQNRDAIALDTARTTAKQQVDAEQADLAKTETQRKRAFDQQLADLNTQFTREHQQRLLKYERDLADAQNQYNRETELQAIQQQRKERDLAIAEQREREQLQRSESQKLALLNKTHMAELHLINQSAQARAQIEEQLIDRMLLIARQRLGEVNRVSFSGQGTSRSGRVRTMATGGPLNAAHSAIVNELRREGFQSGGRTIQLPQGMGLFTPARSGRVLPNGGGLNLNVNVNGVSEATVHAASRAQAMQIIDQVFDDQGVA